MADVRVLIVDDQLPFREAARMVVEMTDGFEVAGEAGDGEEGVEMTRALKPDLVLMDVQMPGIDGLEATRRIRELNDPPEVMVMSTHESGDYRETALDAGAYAFIPKSEFSMDALEELWRQASS
ncbi:MAG: response regulator transcription factor [Acidimicrobiia bacterium]|jgi:DNA-binding NarL/FixJ family response regulator